MLRLSPFLFPQKRTVVGHRSIPERLRPAKDTVRRMLQIAVALGHSTRWVAVGMSLLVEQKGKRVTGESPARLHSKLLLARS